MTPTEIYVFSIFVFVLLCALLFIYRRFIAQPKGRKSPPAGGEEGDASTDKEREERLFKLYQNMEDMMDNFEAYIEDTRDQMESVKRQMQQQADGMADMLKRVEAAEAGARSVLAALRAGDKPEPRKEAVPVDKTEAPPAAKGRRNGRNDAVKELLEKGMTVEQIAQQLELSINEVRLIVYGLMTKNVESK
jgi:hypothetical protein